MSGEVWRGSTLEVLEHTLFSQGLGREPSEFQRAVTAFREVGRVDLLDLLASRPFLPRWADCAGRQPSSGSTEAVENIIDRQGASLIAAGGRRRATC